MLQLYNQFLFQVSLSSKESEQNTTLSNNTNIRVDMMAPLQIGAIIVDIIRTFSGRISPTQDFCFFAHTKFRGCGLISIVFMHFSKQFKVPSGMYFTVNANIREIGIIKSAKYRYIFDV